MYLCMLFYDNSGLYYERICPLNFDVAVSVQFMKVSFYQKKKKLTRKTIAGTTLFFFPPST